MAYHVPGPCSLTWNANDIGVTKAGVLVRPNTSLVPITDDHRGVEPGTYLFGGKSAVIEVIGMDIELLEAAGVWDGGVLQLEDSVGQLASAAAQELIITERNGTDQWICQAFATDPQEFLMKSTQEMNMPLLFVVICDPTTGKLFSTVPSYIG